MTTTRYDLLVIGAGSGGVRAARVAAAQGHRVALIEEAYLGGTCVNVGCVPKKLYSYAAHVSEDVHLASSFGWDIQVNGFDWTSLVANKSKEISRLNGIYDRLLNNSGVNLFWGHGRIEQVVDGVSEVSVTDSESAVQVLTAQRVLIATGGTPFCPEFPGSELAITSNEVFDLPALRKRVAVVGGGYIAVEFASIFNALGIETHLIYRGPQCLKSFDADLAHAAQSEYARKGVHLQLNNNIERIEQQGDGFLLTLTQGNTLCVDHVLMATGRVPNLADLGLENTDVQLEDGFVKINERFETTEAGVFALGDVRKGLALTPVALEEAMVFVDQQFNSSERVMDYDNVATAVFSMPNLATVGLTEAQAEQKCENVDVYESEFAALKQSFLETDDKERSYLKLVVDADNDVVVGMHMMSADAGEIIQGFAAAIKAGLTKQQLDQTVGVHPTLAEEFVTMRTKRGVQE
ncbi:MAG: glutathione-disulfide reductase [Pseudomonadota bacterium]